MPRRFLSHVKVSHFRGSPHAVAASLYVCVVFWFRPGFGVDRLCCGRVVGAQRCGCRRRSGPLAARKHSGVSSVRFGRLCAYACSSTCTCLARVFMHGVHLFLHRTCILSVSSPRFYIRARVPCRLIDTNRGCSARVGWSRSRCFSSCPLTVLDTSPNESTESTS